MRLRRVDGGLVFGWRTIIRMEDGRWRGRCEGEREVPFYGRGRVRYPGFLAATTELSPSYGWAKVSVRGIKVFMAPAGRRRRWRQETLELRSVSSVRTERVGWTIELSCRACE